MHNRIFLDPILAARYPEDVLEHLEPLVDLGHIRDGDLELDLGAARPPRRQLLPAVAIAAARTEPARRRLDGWPGDEHRADAQEGEHTAMGWVVDPGGLEELLLRLGSDYGGIPMIDHRERRGLRRHPSTRRRASTTPSASRFLDRHLRPFTVPSTAGVDLRGYFVWSLLDNFEWAEGYAKRFGARLRRLRDARADAEGRVPAGTPA